MDVHDKKIYNSLVLIYCPVFVSILKLNRFTAHVIYTSSRISFHSDYSYTLFMCTPFLMMQLSWTLLIGEPFLTCYRYTLLILSLPFFLLLHYNPSYLLIGIRFLPSWSPLLPSYCYIIVRFFLLLYIYLRLIFTLYLISYHYALPYFCFGILPRNCCTLPSYQ